MPAISPVWLTIAILAVWRVTHLFWGEDGPGDIFVRLRRRAGHGFAGRVLDCFYCLSVWVAAPVSCFLAEPWAARLMVWMALSGAAILLDRFSTKSAPPAVWQETQTPE